MPDSSPKTDPSPRASKPAAGERAPSSSRATVPPSEPRPSSRASFDVLEAQADRPARLQMIVALVLGLVLVAIPLYLWRRPRADSIPVSSQAPEAGLSLPTTAGVTAEEKLVVGEPRVLLCQDPGKKATSADCDHPADLEKALVKAIEDSASCAAKDASGGTIVYVVDVSFRKKSLDLRTPKDGRTLKNAKVVNVCHAAVKGKVSVAALEATPHAHSRYKLRVIATYPGTSTGTNPAATPQR